MKKTLLTLTALAALVVSAQAQLIWNFGTTTPLATASSGSITNITAGSFSIGNSFGTVSTPISTTSASSFTYTGASKQENIGNAVAKGATLDLSSSAFFQVTLTINTGFTFSLSEFDFGARSTSTGATNFALYGSADGFATLGAASLLGSGTIPNDSSSAFYTPTISGVSYGAGTLTLRLYVYGYNGASNPSTGTINTRIDDVNINGIVTPVAVPEPSTYAVAMGGLLVVIATMRRKRS